MHLPVLKEEVIKYLDPKPNENFIDATLGLGGHTKEILKRNGPEGKVLGIEIDQKILKCLRPDLKRELEKGRLILVNDSYVNLKKIVEKYNFKPVKGILFDLGISSWHLEESGRGFTFQRNEPLIMRYELGIRNYELGGSDNLTAERIINEWPEKEIEKILREYGQERFAKRIAKEIVETRKKAPIKTTFQLVEIIKKAIPKRYQRQRIHPATRTFQALRIAVNDELENLKKVLPQTLEVLEKGGKIVIISFHSLEDRIIKNFFKEEKQKGRLKIITKKPIRPHIQEIQKNPRSRSAKLRVAIKQNYE
jgi:16S rRNA (cytosine1402-N4)-methyltransferase